MGVNLKKKSSTGPEAVNQETVNWIAVCHPGTEPTLKFLAQRMDLRGAKQLLNWLSESYGCPPLKVVSGDEHGQVSYFSHHYDYGRPVLRIESENCMLITLLLGFAAHFQFFNFGSLMVERTESFAGRLRAIVFRHLIMGRR